MRLLYSAILGLLLVLQVASQRDDDPLRHFRLERNAVVWSKSAFMLRRATTGQCAEKCLSLGGACSSFEYNKRTRNCFGRAHGAEVLTPRNRPHVRASSRYDFYYMATPVEPRDRTRPTGDRLRPTQPRRDHLRPTERTRAHLRPTQPSYNREVNRNVPKRTTTVTATTTRRARPAIAIATTTAAPLATNSPSECDEPLGMASGRIPDSALTASSHYGTYRPENGRLEGVTSWMAGTNDLKQYLEIDLGRETTLVAIATQGLSYWFAHNYVTTYKVEFKGRGTGGAFRAYSEGGEVVEFVGNTDAGTVKKNRFRNPGVSARRVRIIPTQWVKNIVLRVELYKPCA